MQHAIVLLAALAAGALVLGADAKSMRPAISKAAADKAEFTARGPYFSIPVDVGSNSEQLNLGIESYYGASIVYGPSIKCDGMDSYCVDHKTWDPMSSDSYVDGNGGKTHSFDLALGTVQGVPGTDDMFIGALSLPNAMFAVAKSASTNLQRKSRTSGYIAMTAPADADENKSTMQHFVENLAMPIVTLAAPKQLNGMHTVTIGSENTNNCPTDGWHVYAQVPNDDPGSSMAPWKVMMNGYTYGSMSDKSSVAIAFSAAGDYFVAPKKIANSIYSKLNARYSRMYHGGLVSCSLRDSADDIVLHGDDGMDFKIPARDYIKRFNGSTCLLNIYPDELNEWTLPYQFHQGKCIKYDYGAKTVSIVPSM